MGTTVTIDQDVLEDIPLAVTSFDEHPGAPSCWRRLPSSTGSSMVPPTAQPTRLGVSRCARANSRA